MRRLGVFGLCVLLLHIDPVNSLIYRRIAPVGKGGSLFYILHSTMRRFFFHLATFRAHAPLGIVASELILAKSPGAYALVLFPYFPYFLYLVLSTLLAQI